MICTLVAWNCFAPHCTVLWSTPCSTVNCPARISAHPGPVVHLQGFMGRATAPPPAGPPAAGLPSTGDDSAAEAAEFLPADWDSDAERALGRKHGRGAGRAPGDGEPALAGGAGSGSEASEDDPEPPNHTQVHATCPLQAETPHEWGWGSLTWQSAGPVAAQLCTPCLLAAQRSCAAGMDSR